MLVGHPDLQLHVSSQLNLKCRWMSFPNSFPGHFKKHCNRNINVNMNLINTLPLENQDILTDFSMVSYPLKFHIRFESCNKSCEYRQQCVCRAGANSYYWPERFLYFFESSTGLAKTFMQTCFWYKFVELSWIPIRQWAKKSWEKSLISSAAMSTAISLVHAVWRASSNVEVVSF